MSKPCPTHRQRSSEDGYILVWAMFLLAIFTIWLAVAIPDARKEIQRDREVETMERGKQYIRAVQLYYRRFHAFPPNQNALVNTNQIRFLRKKYIDPMTGKDDWKPILFGQAKTQTLGFFGQPIAGAGSAGGSLMAGIGPSGGGSPAPGGLGSPAGSSIVGSSDAGTTPNANGSTTGTSTSTSGTNSSDTGLTGQTFGGAGIIGFSPASPKQSILTYKKKNHYNEWEFIYDPMTEMRNISGNTNQIGQPASTIGSPGTSPTPGSSPTPAPGSSSTPPSTPQQ